MHVSVYVLMSDLTLFHFLWLKSHQCENSRVI